MKTTNLIPLLSLFLLISFSSFADGGEVANKENNTTNVKVEAPLPGNDLIVINLEESLKDMGLPQDIRDQFQENVCYPEDVETENEEDLVIVGFTYDDDGFINVSESASSDEAFEVHVIDCIEKIRLRNGNVTIGKTYYAKFSFKKL